ncbi:MAG: sensor histidine kinase, partial [Chitinophagaceae bacterium]
EYTVREQRRLALEDNIAYTQKLSWIISGLSFFLALIGAFFITHQITSRINNMVDMTESIAQGNYKIQIPDTDQDELGRLSNALNSMTRTIDSSFSELARKNKELDQFAYVVSHDLKAPLRGIENASRWVEEDMPEGLPSQIKSYLHMMRGRVHRMENLINGILQLARIGRVNQKRETVDMKEMLLDVIDLLQPPPTFQVILPETMPVILTIRVEIEQVFSNLISNAIKYHNKFDGIIAISMRNIGDFYEFSVKDNGPGIEKEYHEKIFVIFQTLHERDTIESTGVGLAIVKKIVERQGGTIRVESTPGEGSEFIFTWPKDPGKIPAQIAKTKQVPVPITQKND